MLPQCEICGREPLAYDEVCEHPQPIDGTSLTQTLLDLDKFRAVCIAEHAQTCGGFILEDAGMDSERKIPCEICWPEESFHTQSDNISGTEDK